MPSDPNELTSAERVFYEIRGEAIKEAREARDMSQSALAALVGTSQQSIDRIERAVTLHSRHIPAIYDVLGIDAEGFGKREKEFKRQAAAELYLRSKPRGPLISRPQEAVQEKSVTIPVYGFGEDGITLVMNPPVLYLERPEFMGSITTGYGIICDSEEMVPAFRPGDIVLLNRAIPPRSDTEVLFLDKSAQRGVLRTLLSRVEGGWLVRSWSPSVVDEEFSDREWLRPHPVVGKIAR